MEIFKIRIDPDKPEPKYRQLADGIKELIKQGIICGGEFLPGERSLAKEIGVTRDVVHRAYKMLQGEGLIQFTNHRGHRLIKEPFQS